MISGKGVHFFGVGFALLILSQFHKYPMKMRPNYFIFIGYLKRGWGWGGGSARANHLNPVRSF